MAEGKDRDAAARIQPIVSWSVAQAGDDTLSLTLNGTVLQVSRLMARAIGMALVERSTVDVGATQPANDPLA